MVTERFVSYCTTGKIYNECLRTSAESITLNYKKEVGKIT
jgi:hypothetical protein